MATYQYRIITLDTRYVLDGQSEQQEVQRLLNANGSEGWELDRFEFEGTDNNKVRIFYFKKVI